MTWSMAHKGNNAGRLLLCTPAAWPHLASLGKARTDDDRRQPHKCCALAPSTTSSMQTSTAFATEGPDTSKGTPMRTNERVVL